MRIARKALVTPPHNGFYGTVAMAGSVVVFAHSGQLGPLSILLYYAFWLPLILVDTRIWLKRPGDTLLVLSFVGFVLGSSLWSPAPGLTLRGGIQLATHCACAIIAARVIDIPTLTRGMVAGALVVVLYSLAFGRFAYDVLDESYTFVGAFGSKNQLALFCSLGIYFCVALIVSGAKSWLGLVTSVCMAAVFTAALVASRSATSTISLILALGALIFLLGALRFRPATRTTLLLLLLPCGAFAVVIAFYLGAMDAVLAIFGKDSTLTGRTYLWSQGIAAGNLHPAAGAGYQAYWIQGFSEAERLWKEFYIENRFGFHFHNTYIELFVELGYIGLGIYIAILLAIFLRLLWQVATGSGSGATVLFGVFILLLIRSFFEVDSLYPYTVGSFLVVFLAVAVRELPARSSAASYADWAAAHPFSAPSWDDPNARPWSLGASTTSFGPADAFGHQRGTTT